MSSDLPIEDISFWWNAAISLFTSLTNFVHAFSGGVGAAFGIAVCYPLETARTRLQVDDREKPKHTLYVITDIVKEEGIIGLYRGLSSIVLCLFTGSFVYFYVFHGLKAALTLSNQAQDAVCDLAFGAIAGSVTAIVTNPLWVVNTRLKLQGAKLKTDSYKQLRHPHYDGVIDCFQKILQQEGSRELWSGVIPSLLLVSNPAIQFMFYEFLKRTTQGLLHEVVLSSSHYFVFGAVSKAIATLVTYPLQYVQTRIRAGYTGKSILHGDHKSKIWGFSSVLALYRGLESKLLQTVLTAAITLLAYETIAQFVFAMFDLPLTPASSQAV